MLQCVWGRGQGKFSSGPSVGNMWKGQFQEECPKTTYQFSAPQAGNGSLLQSRGGPIYVAL